MVSDCGSLVHLQLCLANVKPLRWVTYGFNLALITHTITSNLIRMSLRKGIEEDKHASVKIWELPKMWRPDMRFTDTTFSSHLLISFTGLINLLYLVPGDESPSGLWPWPVGSRFYRRSLHHRKIHRTTADKRHTTSSGDLVWRSMEGGWTIK